MPNRLILIVLGLGAFAVGTDAFIINGILPSIADAMSVSEAVAGQLITLFALVYAVSSPILATLTTRVPRRLLLASAMALFVVANLIGAVAGAYWVLMTARILAALAAAAYMGPAVAVAVAVVPNEYRGRALSVVAGGLTVATALGVPLGTLVGDLGSWRLTLVLVAALAALTTIGIAVALPAVPQPPVIGLAARLSVVGRKTVLIPLVANMFAVAGTFEVFTYIAPLANQHTPLTGAGVTIVLLAWGLAAIVGNPIGGRSVDRYGAERTFGSGVVVVAVVLAGIGLLTWFAPASHWITAVLLVVAVASLSMAAWALPPAQASRIVQAAPEAPAIATSLNSSSTYLGLSLGSAVGGFVLGSLSSAALGWVGAGLEIVALLFVLLGKALHSTKQAAANPSTRANQHDPAAR